ncbi:MAG: hypothetical protein WC055_05875 [Melioribacteraceae bacterium]
MIIRSSQLLPQIRKLDSNGIPECYILGNGPSLNESLSNDLELLKTKELFVLNDFAISKYFEIIKPKYYVLLDPCYWSHKVEKEFLDAGILILNTINDKVNWQMYILIPTAAYKSKLYENIFSQNKNISIINFNSTSIFGFTQFKYFVFKNYLGMPPLNTVLGASIFIAINMHYNEINLLGAEHSWTKDIFVKEDNLVCLENPHFYDTAEIKYSPIRTAYGNYYTMHELLRDYAKMFEGYHILRRYSENLGIRILNRTKNSFIDAFDRQ